MATSGELGELGELTNEPKIERRERPMKERFDHAVTVIRSLPKDGPFQPSNMMKLKFYGLFKQATQGVNDTAKPGFWDPTARAKWEAWNLCGDMTKEEAMKMYIKELEQIIETMPQTKEVEEFLKMIGPFYESVEEKRVTKELPDQAPNPQISNGNRVPSDSEDEVEFQDSYDNLPDSTPQKKMRDDTYTGGSPSDITPLKSSLLVGAKPSMETLRSKEVRFSGVDPVPRNEEGHAHPVSDPVNALEMFNELVTKLQVVVDQLNSIVQARQLQSSMHRTDRNKKRRALIGIFCQVLPLVSVIMTVFLNNRIITLPWWLNSLVMLCSVLVSTLL